MERFFTILLVIYISINYVFPQDYIFSGHCRSFKESEIYFVGQVSLLKNFNGSESALSDSLIFYSPRVDDVNYLRRKAFYEHLIVISDDNTKIIIDPILDFRLNYSKSYDRKAFGYFSRKGFAVSGKVFSKLYFNTYFDDNIGYMPFAVDNYFNHFGIIPGYARIKHQDKDIYLYKFFNSYSSLSVNINRIININLGYDKQFVGDGYRSMFLSNFAPPMPYLKTKIKLFDIIEINNLFTKAINPNYNNVMLLGEASKEQRPFPSKTVLYNTLTYKPNKYWQLSLLEALVLADSVETIKTIAYELSPYFNNLYVKNDILTSSLIGLNVCFQSKSVGVFYSQYIIDNLGLKTKAYASAFQLGYKTYNFFNQKDMFFQIEYNHADNTMYMHPNNRLHYGHFNQALAHPSGHGFDEVLLILGYFYKGLEISSKQNFLSYNYGMEFANLKNIYDFNYTQAASYGRETKNLTSLLNSELQFVYTLNYKLRLQVFASFGISLYYKDRYNYIGLTSFSQFGFRTALRENFYDF